MTDDINDKVLAVFLAAIMALSMIAVGAVSLGGVAAAQNVVQDEGEPSAFGQSTAQDITITEGTTIVDDMPRNGSAVFNGAPPVYEANPNIGPIVPDDVADAKVLSGQHVGATGVPFHTSLYAGLGYGPYMNWQAGTDDAPQDYTDNPQQTISISWDIVENDGEEEFVTVDFAESTEIGLQVNTDVTNGDTVQTQIENQLNNNEFGEDNELLNVDVDNQAEEVRIEYVAATNASVNDLTFDLTWEPSNPWGGLNVEAVHGQHDASIYHVLRAPSETEDDRYRAVEVGATAITPGDTGGNVIGELANETDIRADGDADGTAVEGGAAESFHVWHHDGDFSQGQKVTFIADNPTDEIAIWEVEENDDGEYELPEDPIHSDEPYPGHAITWNVNELELEPNTRYFVTFNGGEDVAVLDVRELGLEAEFRDSEVDAGDDLRIDVSAEDAGGEVEAWFWEAGAAPVTAWVAHAERDELDGTGDTVIRVTPEDVLADEGEFEAVVLHRESEEVVFVDPVEIIEPEDAEVMIESPHPGAEFPRGDIIPVELQFEGTDTGTFTFGDPGRDSSNVEINVTVRDVDESGSAQFFINTFQIGHGYILNSSDDRGISENFGAGETSRNHGFFTFDPGTALLGDEGQSAVAHPTMDILGGSQQGAVLDSMSYDMVSISGDQMWRAQNDLDDRQVIRMTERDGSTLAVNAAPGTGENAIDPETTDELDELRDDGFLNPADGAIAEDDLLVVEVESDGLTGLIAEAWQSAVADADANTDPVDVIPASLYDRAEDHLITDEFSAAIGSALIDFELTTTEVDVPGNVEAIELGLVEERVIADANDWGNFESYFIPIQLEAGEDIVSTPDNRALEPGQEFNTTFRLAPTDTVQERVPNLGLQREEESLAVDWQFQTAFADVDRNPETNPMWEPVNRMLEVPPEEGVDIHGVTNVAAGTNLTVELDTRSGQDVAFYRQHTEFVTYDEGIENAWNITESFGEEHNAPEGTEFTIQFRRAGAAGTINPGERVSAVVDQAPEVTTFEFNDQEIARQGQVVTVDAFESNQGGIIVIYDEDGNALGQSSMLSAGLQERVTIALDEDLAEGDNELTAAAYVDADGEEAYEEERVATVTVPGEDVDPADFRVSDLTPSVSIDEPGDAASISATVSNNGEETGTQTVEVTFDGEVVDSEDVTLEGGDSHSVSVDLETGDLDYGTTYEYTVSTGDDSETGVVTVAAEPEPEDDTDDEVVDEETDDEADDDGAGFGIVVAALALLGAALLAVRRQVE